MENEILHSCKVLGIFQLLDIKVICIWQGRWNQVSWGHFPPPYFGRSVNPILTRGQIMLAILLAPGFPNLPPALTALSIWLSRYVWREIFLSVYWKKKCWAFKNSDSFLCKRLKHLSKKLDYASHILNIISALDKCQFYAKICFENASLYFQLRL